MPRLKRRGRNKLFFCDFKVQFFKLFVVDGVWRVAHKVGSRLYLGECDYVFNSFLPYELAVMKKYALPLLQALPNDSPYHSDAHRLIGMLKFFIDMSNEWVPSNSLMREFIGGSCYADV